MSMSSSDFPGIKAMDSTACSAHADALPLPGIGCLLIEGRTGFGLIFLTIAFFQLWSEVVGLLPCPRAVTREPVDAFRVFRWKNLVVSWSHACVTGTWCLVCICLYGDQMWEDMMGWKNWVGFGVACFSTGYFLYDAIDIVLFGRIREKWEILLHHFAICLGAFYSVSTIHGIGYHVVAMLIEFNTAFLHSRQLLLMSGFPRSSAPVQILMALNLLTFVFFRFVPLYIEAVAVFHHWWRVPPWFVFTFVVSILALIAINGILFWRLLRADFLRGDSAASSILNVFSGGGKPETLRVQQNGIGPGDIGKRLSRPPAGANDKEQLCDSLAVESDNPPPPTPPDSRQEEDLRNGHKEPGQLVNGSDASTRFRGSSLLSNVDRQLDKFQRSLAFRI